MTPRRVLTAVLIATLFFTAAEFIWLGSEDVNGALTYAGRLNGAFLLLVALIELAALAAYCHHLAAGARLVGYAGAAVVVAIAISMLVNFTLLALQAESWSYTHCLWVWLLLSITSLLSLAFLYTRHQRQQIELPRPRSLAIGALFTTMAAAVNFGYAQIYQPYSTPASVSTTVELGKAHIANGRVMLPVRLRSKNTGSVTVYALGSLFQVSARGPIATDAPRTKQDWLQDISDSQAVLLRYSDERKKKYDLLAQGRFMRVGRKLDPGTEVATDSLVEFPESASYEAINATADMVYMRADRVVLTSEEYARSGRNSWHMDKSHPEVESAPAWVADHGTEILRYQSRIVHSNAFLEHTRTARYATLWWVLEEPDKTWFGPYLVAKVSPADEVNIRPAPAEPQQLTAAYGLDHSPSGRTQTTVQQLLN
ncbi:hypothetical protein [Streptomyces sp. Root1310]|uniref:hypothetical protein n=1 Tax=Streptomyces sp. Root1310 TaxID=1736452 RepID=UPI000728027C|nr:hypothetical protein [Streptomyces sp. Root1310]KQX80704.1 hypothetical protein ASD48_32245 [Streptomyces sp. Root1310]